MELMELYDLAEEQGHKVYSFDLSEGGVECMSVQLPDGSCAIAIDPMRLESTREEKTKLGHELGHCCTGSFYNQYAACDVRQKHENRADKWEIAHLLPREKLMEAVRNGYREAWELADFFDVCEELVRKAMRWYSCGCLEG